MTFIQEIDDAFVFGIDSETAEKITEFKENHRKHGHLDCTKISVGIDADFRDVIYPDVVKMEFSVIFDMESSIVISKMEDN